MHTPPSQHIGTLNTILIPFHRRQQNTLETAARAMDNASSQADAAITEYHKAEAAAKKHRGF